MEKMETVKLLKFQLLRKGLLIVMLALFVSNFAKAQQSTINGNVTDKSGEPIPGVSILVKGTDIGTISDFDGNYVINAELPADAILVFSYMGMKAQEVVPGEQTVINVILEEETLGLDEIVVIGYGSQQKKDITGSVSLVTSDDMTDRPNTQVGSLIQGKAAGVKILSSSGKPSQGLSIRIRGTNSISAGNEPLYVVDGIPTTDTRSLNPSDIESISILKDASSAAIYGAQGANGVVIITTKKGTTEKPTVTLNAYMGFSQVWKTQKVLNGEQYRDLMTMLGYTPAGGWDQYTANTDWQNEIFQNGISQNYQLAVSGKSNKTSYYLSSGWTQQKGAVRSSEMDRANFKINLDQEINEWFKVGTRIAYTKYSDVDVNDASGVGNGGVLIGALNTPSVIGIYTEDGMFAPNPFQDWINPVGRTDGLDREYNSQRILGNIYAEITLPKNFSYKINFGIDNSHGVYDEFLDPYRTNWGKLHKGIGKNTTNKSSYYMIENLLKYNKEMDKHSINALIGTVSQKFLWENSSIDAEGYPSDVVKTINAASTITNASSDKAEKANTSFIGRVNYAFADKYLATVNFRADGSSAFGPDYRWGYFPSFSAGWRISQESFLEGLEIISDLKLRAGWGIVGNDQIGNYEYLGLVGNGANYPLGSSLLPGTYPASIENKTLRWEETQQTNIGVDLALFNGRLRFTADAYYKKTKDLLLKVPMPTTTGFGSASQNIGSLENKGLEFSIGSINIDKEIKWTTDFNISFNKNEVTNILGSEIFSGNIAGRGFASLVREGESLGTFYGYEFGGVDPATGQAYYIAANGESVFIPDPDTDRKIIGNANPDFTYGLTNTLSYKGISLLVFIEGSYGNDMLNATRFDTEDMINSKNQTTVVLDRWRQPGDITDVPGIETGGTTNNSLISTRFIEDGSYLRLKTASLSYQLPTSIVSKIKLQGVRVYVTGENLLTFTNYSGFDPEVNTFGGSSDNETKNTALGVDYGTYPQTRNLIFGLNVTF